MVASSRRSPTAAFGFCAADDSGPDQCQTAATDPCMGVAQCGIAPSRACDSATVLADCAANAFGCFVETATDCSATSEVCDASSGMALCVDPCSLVTLCPSASYCDAGAAVTCTADVNGCLVETARDACDATETCLNDGTASSCVDTCPEAGMRVIGCGDTMVPGDTSMGSTVFGSYPGCTTLSYASAEQVWRFSNPGTTRRDVTIVSTRGTSTADFDLFVLDGSAGSDCASPVVCLNGSTSTGATETVRFVAEPGATEYVVYDLYGSTMSSTTTDYTLTVTCTDIVCGDGSRHASEGCDDGNTMTGDGCSDTCAVEPGYRCDGTPPMCRPTAENSACGTGTVITGTTTITGEDIARGGPRATGTGCGTTSTGNDALYYAVTVPARTRVAVATTSTLDRVLLVQDTCAGGCSVRTDTAPEGTVLVNQTAAPITRFVSVHNATAGATGTYDISFTYIPLPANATCEGATSITGTTTITGEDISLGGARPQGTNCGTSTGNNAYYYAVTVPPATFVEINTPNGTFDRVLLTQDACGAASCTFRTDSSPEAGGIRNDTASPITRIVAVHNFSSGTTGTYDISFTYQPLPMNATCASARSITSTTTITDERIAGGGPRPQGTDCGTSSGNNAIYYEVTVPAMGIVEVSTTGTFDRVLLVQDMCGATSCTFRTDASPEGTTLTNMTAIPVTRIVAIHNFTAGVIGTYSITFRYPACGDGVVSSSIMEQCDDGNMSSTDGCSDTCQIEPGFACSGTPSVCLPLASNSTCAGARAITATTSVTGENIGLGGPRPMGTGCGTTSGNSALYYAVTIPASTRVDIATVGSVNRVLLVQDMCGAAACTFRTDSSPEGTSLLNSGTTPITRIVAIHNNTTADTGLFNVSFTYVALAPNATCAGGTSVTADVTLTGQNIALGGPRPTGTGCSSGSGNNALYYTVTVPAMTQVDVVATPMVDVALVTLDSCSATSCTALSDDEDFQFAPEYARLTNSTGAPVTRVIAVHNFAAAQATGTFDIAFTYAPAGTGESCTAPIPIALGDARTGSTTVATADLVESSAACTDSSLGYPGRDIVYAFTPIASGTVTITLEPTSDWDPGLWVMSPSCSGASCTFDADNGGSGADEVLILSVTAAQTYFIVVDGWTASAHGDFTLSIL
jgi:cysteine-rich repeat protein